MTNQMHNPTEDELRPLLVGKKIVAARIADERPDSWMMGPVGYLDLDDGTTLKVWGNDGGCACSAGCYPLESLNACDNIITNVEVEARPGGDDVPCYTCGDSWCWNRDHETRSDGHYRIFVYAEDVRINVASFEGTDGNGWYGTGFWVEVSDE